MVTPGLTPPVIHFTGKPPLLGLCLPLLERGAAGIVGRRHHTAGLSSDGARRLDPRHPVRPMYLLRYRRDGELRAVVIANAYSVAHARMIAAGLEPGRFVDGHRVNRASVTRLPIDIVGRVLTITDLIAVAEATIGSVRRRVPPA